MFQKRREKKALQEQQRRESEEQQEKREKMHKEKALAQKREEIETFIEAYKKDPFDALSEFVLKNCEKPRIEYIETRDGWRRAVVEGIGKEEVELLLKVEEQRTARIKTMCDFGIREMPHDGYE